MSRKIIGKFTLEFYDNGRVDCFWHTFDSNQVTTGIAQKGNLTLREAYKWLSEWFK